MSDSSCQTMKDKYKTLIDIINQTIEKEQGFLFHIYMHKLIRDYQSDYYIVPRRDEQENFFDSSEQKVNEDG